MLAIYIKSAWRNLKVNKFYSFLNILGLTIGLATAILLLLWVKTEKGYDQFNSKVDNIYRINNAYKTSDGENIVWTTSPAPINNIAKDNPGVMNVVRIFQSSGTKSITYKSKKLFDLGGIAEFVDPYFFKLFSFQLVEGDMARPFPFINSIVLSVQMAKKLFQDTNAIGKMVYLNGSEPFQVSGIMADMPHNTSLTQASIFLPMANWEKTYADLHKNSVWKTIDDNYGDFSYDIFAEVAPGANIAKISGQVTRTYSYLGGPDVSGNVFTFQPLSTMHLIDENGSKRSLHMVQVFNWVAVLILLIASVNYVNLSTARALVRVKEVSVRKILGAMKGQLLLQFLTETFLLFIISFCLSILLVILLIPVYKNVTGNTSLFNQVDGWMISSMIWVLVFTFTAVAFYPALLLSNFRPIQYLKGKVKSGKSTQFGRKLLVVIQFSISVVIIFSAIIMMKQMHYIKTKDVGYNRSEVFLVNMPSEMTKHSEAVLQDLKQSDAILTATTASSDISNIAGSSGSFGIPGRNDINLIFHDMEVNPNFTTCMHIKLNSGMNFSGDYADSGRFLINETAVRLLNLKTPIGTEILYNGKKGQIWGVLRDFNFESLKEKVGPLILTSNAKNQYGSILYVRASEGAIQEAIKTTEKLFKQYGSDLPFKYTFMDKHFASQYAKESRTVSLLNVFASIAIFISCLGLFGLATFTAQAKAKEIGIRKVLGAKKSDIVKLISKDFLTLVSIAIILSLPVANWIMVKWLREFAYKISTDTFTFLFVALIVLLIAFLTIASKAYYAARANPIGKLKEE